jgi:hypothetical protein
LEKKILEGWIAAKISRRRRVSLGRASQYRGIYVVFEIVHFA